MLIAAIICFSLAALMGAILFTYVLKGKKTPRTIVYIHGTLASAGLVLIILYAFMHKPGPLGAIVAFMIAALGGLILVIRDLTGKSLPGWLAVIHGLVALTGFVLLILFVTGGNAR